MSKRKLIERKRTFAFQMLSLDDNMWHDILRGKEDQVKMNYHAWLSQTPEDMHHQFRFVEVISSTYLVEGAGD